MDEAAPHILLKIDTAQPIELGDFVSLFVAIGNQFERFAASQSDDDPTDARFYIKEIRPGCIEAELIGWFAVAGPILGGAMAAIKHANDIQKFVENFGGRVSRYFSKGGRDETATRSDLVDFHKAVVAIAHDADGSLALSAAIYEDGKRDVRVAFQFDTSQAREAEREIAEHRRELEHVTDSDHSRVLMTFTRTNVAHAKTGKRSGDQVLIEAIHPKPLPIVYASTLAEERVRHEIAEADENVYKKGFDVDVNVELRKDRPIAYRIVAIHDVIDLPDPE